MRGPNITNKYIIDSREYLFSELSKGQLGYVESIADKTKYNNLRNQVLEEQGDGGLVTNNKFLIQCNLALNI